MARLRSHSYVESVGRAGRGLRERALRSIELLSNEQLRRELVPHVLIGSAALIAVSSWYRGQQLVWGVDTAMPLSLNALGRYFHITDATLGSPDVRKLPFVLPLGGILWLWRVIGIPYDPALLQRVLLVAALATAGIGTYWFLRCYLPRLETIAIVGACLFYMFNLFALVTIWTPLSNLVFHYSLLPTVLFVWLWALRRRTALSGIVAGVVWSLTLTPSYITTPVIVTDFLLLSGIAAVEFRRTIGRDERRRMLSTMGLIATTWLALNAFWIVPTLYYLHAESIRGLAIGLPSDLIALNGVALDKAIRLGGYWGLSSGYKGSLYFPWAGFFTGGYGVWLGLLLPLLALGSLRQLSAAPRARFCPACGSPTTNSRRRIVWCTQCGKRIEIRVARDDTGTYLKFFFLVLAVSLLFMTGPNEPFGSAKAWVMTRSGWFAPFRSLYQRFGEYATIAYAPLVAGGLQSTITFVRRRVPRWAKLRLGEGVAGGLIAVLAVVLAAPMWTGALFDSSGVIPSRRITIPPEYDTVAHWIDEHSGDFTVLALPFGPSATTALSWSEGQDGYFGVEPLQLLSSKPFLVGDPSASYVNGLVAQASEGGPRAWPALRLLNSRYVVVHLDANGRYLRGLDGWIGTDTVKVTQSLDHTQTLRLVRAVGALRVYEVTKWRPFQIFGVRNYQGISLYSLPFEDVRTVRYDVLGPGRFVVADGQLKPGELLVLNHPFDPLWTVQGASSTRVAPGLTGFRAEWHGSVFVTHRLEARFPLLLALAPTAVGTLGLVLVWRRRRSRTTPGE